MKYYNRYLMMCAILIMVMPHVVSAATITLLTEAEYIALIPTGDLAIENLESYPEGLYPATQDFSIFQYTVSSGAVSVNRGFELGIGFNNTLSSTLIDDRLFEFTPDDQVFVFGTEMKLSSFGSGPQTFEVTVTGNSGVSIFQFDRTSLDWSDWLFTGFQDPLGLISIEYSNLGFTNVGTEYSNYNFDNIRVLTTPVPIPPAMLLFVSGFLVLMGFVRKR